MKNILKLLTVFLLAVSCQPDAVIYKPEAIKIDESPGASYIENPLDIWSVNQEGQYALNVVFFKPTDMEFTNENFKNVSNMMLFIQSWYGVQMKANGYNKTFGLMTNQDGEVRINVIDGAEASTSYDSQDSSKIKAELNAYFADAPDKKSSDHYLVLGFKDSGVGFYANGKIGFATSPDFVLSETGKTIDGLELLKAANLGGIIHELGHALNLPHAAHKGSDSKISLMSFGNQAYQNGNEENVFLIPSSAAILNTCQVFNKTNDGIAYYAQSPGVTLSTYKVIKDDANGKLMASGTFSADVMPTALYIGEDGFPYSNVNESYDMVTFVKKIGVPNADNLYEFSVEIPYSDLFNGYKDDAKDAMENTLNIIFENGERIEAYSYEFTMDLISQVPNNDVVLDYLAWELSDRSSWAATANTSSQPIGNIIDSDIATYWHSGYPYRFSEKPPHELTFDMGEMKNFDQIYMYSDRSGGYFLPKQIKVQTSTDGVTYTDAADYSVPDKPSAKHFVIKLNSPVNVQYFKLLVSEVYTFNGVDNLFVCEVDVK
ncbi:discoidin domain-containing protein [Aestuariivivens insulae]|uniref:discoidin domain-containing protein n=1 Tax=Aestuariivivens insulae TaxID=1621988 RepID=UPI001F586639|nr:discoidin domain-containing protein [Aestuariivivens insulae]